MPVPLALPHLGRCPGQRRTVLAVRLVPIEPLSVPSTSGGYVNAMAVEASSGWLFISGQIPETRDGYVPGDAEEQCRLIWANITAVLAEAGMTAANLVKVTTFLGDRAHAAANTAVCKEVLGDHRPGADCARSWDLRSQEAPRDRSRGRSLRSRQCR